MSKRKTVKKEPMVFIHASEPYREQFYSVGDDYPAGLYIAYETGMDKNRILVDHVICDYGDRKVRTLQNNYGPIDQRIYTHVYGPLPNGVTK